jgi:hypothetical protein
MYQINMSRCVSNIYMFTVICIVPYGVRQTGAPGLRKPAVVLSDSVIRKGQMIVGLETPRVAESSWRQCKGVR